MSDSKIRAACDVIMLARDLLSGAEEKFGGYEAMANDFRRQAEDVHMDSYGTFRSPYLDRRIAMLNAASQFLKTVDLVMESVGLAEW